MPTYTFECELDGFFERQLSMVDVKSEIECPVCKGAASRRYDSIPVVFKGTGFYKTDSKK